MSLPQLTYELKIEFNENKKSQNLRELVKAFLFDLEITSFVEGSVDDIDIDYDIGDQSSLDKNYEDLSEKSGISVFKYERDELEILQTKIQLTFKDSVSMRIESLPTKNWMEGWKQSFKPITTEKFYIHPPWEVTSADPQKISLVIEPGMAFGTGNHATTQLCLAAIERNFTQLNETKPSDYKILDLGTGSGILAIALAKLGFRDVFATDIDADSIMATQKNAAANLVKINLRQGSVVLPHGFAPYFNRDIRYDFIVANILFPILRDLMPNITNALKAKGELILSGLIVEDEIPMREVCKGFNLNFRERHQNEDWLCLSFVKG